MLGAFKSMAFLVREGYAMSDVMMMWPWERDAFLAIIIEQKMKSADSI